MTRRGTLPLLIILSFLSAAGCAGPNGASLKRPQAPRLSEKAEEENHAELERDLSLYSD